MHISHIPDWRYLNLPKPCFIGDIGTLECCPGEAGCYLVWLLLTEDTTIQRPGRLDLSAGCYVYAGSARGPGGLRARLSRHLRKEKSIRWHVDQLTTEADQAIAWAWHEGSECELVTKLSQSNAFDFPARHFGSSDCKHCPSHLLKLN